MVSVGLGDFLLLLLVLSDQGLEGDIAYGRCPDCGHPVDGAGVSGLIGELLTHELQYHPEHAEHDSRVCPGDIEDDAYGDDTDR